MLERLIADGVTELVVDALEVVDIQHRQAQRRAGPARPRELTRQRDIQPAAVGQRGERVGQGEALRALQLVLRLVELRACALQFVAAGLHLVEQPACRRRHGLEHLGPRRRRYRAPLGLRQQRIRFVAETGEVGLQAVVGLADDAQQAAHHFQQRLVGAGALGRLLLRRQPGDASVLRLVVFGRWGQAQLGQPMQGLAGDFDRCHRRCAKRLTGSRAGRFQEDSALSLSACAPWGLRGIGAPNLAGQGLQLSVATGTCCRRRIGLRGGGKVECAGRVCSPDLIRRRKAGRGEERKGIAASLPPKSKSKECRVMQEGRGVVGTGMP